MAWVAPASRDDETKEDYETEQKARGENKRQGSDSTSERSTANSQKAGKLLAVNDRVDFSLPDPRANVPLSSTNHDNGEGDDDLEGILEMLAQVRRDVTHGEGGERDDGASGETDPEGGVRGKNRETGDTEIIEESVAIVEKQYARPDAEGEKEEDEERESYGPHGGKEMSLVPTRSKGFRIRPRELKKSQENRSSDSRMRRGVGHPS